MNWSTPTIQSLTPGREAWPRGPKQVNGIDIVTDGEQGKEASLDINDRFNGLSCTGPPNKYATHGGQRISGIPDYYAWSSASRSWVGGDAARFIPDGTNSYKGRGGELP